MAGTGWWSMQQWYHWVEEFVINKIGGAPD
jgi:hypothetical protein